MGLFNNTPAVTEVEPDELDAQLAEAEARMAEVAYYRSLTNADLFGAGEGDTIAPRVQARVAEFAKREIAKILGVGQDAPPAPETRERLEQLAELSTEEVAVLRVLLAGLTEHDVRVLRTVVSRMAADPAAVGPLLRPTIKPVAAPKATPPKPVVRKSAPAARPAPVAKKEPVKQPAPPPEPPPEEKPTGTPRAKLRSPTAKPFPRGEQFSVEMEAKARSAVNGADRAIGRTAEAFIKSEAEHMGVDGERQTNKRAAEDR